MYEGAVKKIRLAIAELQAEKRMVLDQIAALERSNKAVATDFKGLAKTRKASEKVVKIARKAKKAAKKVVKKTKKKAKKVMTPEQRKAAQSKRMKAFWKKKLKDNPKPIPKGKPGRKSVIKGKDEKTSDKMLSAWAAFKKKKQAAK